MSNADSNGPPGAEPRSRTLIVGVGASAGGLEAFTRLLESLPPRPGLALLLVQHLDPTHESLLAGILSRVTDLRVLTAVEGMPIEADHVYVIPPGARMAVAGGLIHVEPRGDRAAPHLPVDHLFRSLADELGARAIGVVLSGGGSDGTEGVEAIKAAGGITYAQDEASAAQPSMPASAVASGFVDAVMPPLALARVLAGLATRTPLTAADDDGEAEARPGGPPSDGLDALLVFLRKRTGIDFAHYKRSTIERRVQRRVALRGFETVAELLESARASSAEESALVRDLLIGVTRFFRDPASFEALEKTALPAMIRDRPSGAALRIWVPGCSTGEEAYSIAICLLETLGESANDTPIKILATDINEESLAKARAGVYSEAITTQVSPERLRRFFRRSESRYAIAKSVRDLVVFSRHDVTRDAPFARMDLVSCRNLLIYLDATLQRRVLPLLHYALRPNGYLLLGPAETVGGSGELFDLADRDGPLYVRKPVAARVPFFVAGRGETAGIDPATRVDPRIPSIVPDATSAEREADRILARYAPPGVLVDDNLTVLQFRGETERYLTHPHGSASLDLMRMARVGLLADLRAGVEAARASSAPVTRAGVRVIGDGTPRSVELRVLPLRTGPEGARCFLILFEDEGAGAEPGAASATALAAPPPRPPEAGRPDADAITELRHELDASREHLQAVIEEYEAANEELKSANEEILASNEELQATNQELQNAKEEMRSANEELETVNEELQYRNRDLGRVNDDLANLLAGVHIPVVMVGRDLRIRRLTSQATTALSLLPSDVGRPLRDVRLGLDLPDLDAAIARVIATLESTSFEVRDRAGRWLSVRIRPYETLEHKIDGAVISVVDVDVLKRAEVEIRESRDFVSTVLDSARISMVVLDANSRIRIANRTFATNFQVATENLPGVAFLELAGGLWNVPQLHELLDRVRAGGDPIEGFEIERDLPTVGARVLHVNARRVASEDGAGPLVLLSIDDVTEERHAERARHELDLAVFRAQKLESLGRLAGGVAHDLNNLLTPILGNAELGLSLVPTDSPVAPVLSEVSAAAGKAAALIGQLLTFAGKGQRFTGPVGLRQLVTEIRGLFEAAIEERATLHYELSPASLTVVADSAQIKQILMNLVVNAAEAVGEGGGTITVRTREIQATTDDLKSPYLIDTLAAGPYALIEVSDDGSGLDSETIEKLFDPFHSTKFLGRGLGLASALGIVRSHRGTIQVASQPGRGSTFRLLLPLAPSEPSRAGDVPAAHPAAPGAVTALVVDDEPAVRALATRILRSGGIVVVEARDGAEAAELFRRRGGEIDLVLLDVSVPRVGGLEALERLRELRPTLPIVVMSGFASRSLPASVLAHPATRYLPKPFGARELLSTVHQALEAREPAPG
ncbi:MAG: response regulator [Deltaproteobacteria bacterium]|nr:response regulator [Deltaproteobacteria bacterium]